MSVSGRVDISIEPLAIRLRAHTDEVDAQGRRSPGPPGHESLGVVIPWSDNRFQYTVKENTLPASGTVTARGQEYRFDPTESFGVLDHGRGRWPYSTTWNWGSASGVADGRSVGLQFGGKWTDGTGMTENALCVDGVLHKIGADLTWAYDRSDWLRPWTIRDDTDGRVDLQFTPTHERNEDTPGTGDRDRGAPVFRFVDRRHRPGRRHRVARHRRGLLLEEVCMRW
ncbi:MAG: DUF2804 domain-containing protein [Candidatus Nanopelagicales bacterium]